MWVYVNSGERTEDGDGDCVEAGKGVCGCVAKAGKGRGRDWRVVMMVQVWDDMKMNTEPKHCEYDAKEKVMDGDARR